ncbi:threonine-phosphate decarboxylase CobD [cf. Phormidesmis sp. LEGE 11477]|uniref:threonine-phosphate decarboxylase CobD n=1 Tax=cf. Phormidesmis sp. LEGE 11477 TaxID=1828680 RepID=UPI0018822EED|nr:threonine-phosphate decarboxylase CobD [cf. Phormidesmis sp. LEGE 11477]MBE9063068.1 threonine-phosphate decarboxylase [cf. Phormidesmis sp. LEGE 11477]
MSRPVHGGNLTWAAELAQCLPHELLDFSASISPLGPPPSVREAIRAAFSSVTAYPDPAYRALRKAIAYHHYVPIDYILPGNGAAELLTYAARDLALLQRPTLRLIPGFSDYDRALKSFDAQLLDVPLLKPSVSANTVDTNASSTDSWRFKSWDTGLAMPKGVPSDECGLLLNNPHNPTGAVFSKERLRSLLSKFALVVIDEAFMDFLPPEQDQSLIDAVCDFPNLIIIRSLTKFYSMPGVRLGYAIAQPQTLGRWRQWRDPWSVNTFAAAAGIAALEDSTFQRQTWDWLKAAGQQFYGGLTALAGLTPLPSCVNFFLVACDVSATVLQEQLLKRHQIYIRDCISFAELGDRYFRVAIKTEAENQKLLAALAEVLPQLRQAR